MNKARQYNVIGCLFNGVALYLDKKAKFQKQRFEVLFFMDYYKILSKDRNVKPEQTELNSYGGKTSRRKPF